MGLCGTSRMAPSNLCCLLQANAAPAQAADPPPAAPVGDVSEEETEVTEQQAPSQTAQ